MKRTTRGALLALLMLAPLVPLANAGVPQPPAWSPYTAPEPVTALALADAAGTIAAALGPWSETGECPTPPTQACLEARAQPFDLAILKADTGFVTAYKDNVEQVSPGGRLFVAVSDDGNTIASIGYDRQLASTTPTPTTPRLYYARAGPGGSWTTGTANLSAYLSGTPVGLALSDDGNRVALALDTSGNITIRGFSFASGILSNAFTYITPGRPVSIAASDTLGRIGVVGVTPAGGVNRSVAFTFSFATGLADSQHAAPDGVTLGAVAMSPDGERFAVGGTNGTLLLFRGASGSSPPQQLAGGNGTVARVAFSGDGTRLAAASADGIRAYDMTAAAPALAWQAALAAAPRSIDYNHTGGLLLVGSSDGVRAFNEAGGQMWQLRGNTTSVAVNADASTIAYAQGRLVFSAALGRGLALAFKGGGDTGPTQTITPSAEAVYSLSVHNPGAVTERVRFEGPEDLDVDVRFEPAEALVNPDETIDVTAFVRPGQLQSGSRTFNVTARAVTSGITDDATLTFDIAPFSDVSLFLNVTEVLAVQGETHELLLEVLNTGTEAVALSVRADASVSEGAAWNVTLDPESFTLNPNSKTTVRASVTPPRNAANGTSNTITYRLEGAQVADAVTVVYRINPQIGIELVPAARVKFIEAGKSDTFNVTVRNTGSLPRRFEVTYDINETSDRLWGIEMPTEAFRLDPLESRTVTIKVTVPVEARPPDYLKFTVTAQLLPEGDEPVVKSSVPIFANAEEPKPEDEDEDEGNLIPNPSVALFGALAALAALAMRRRRHA